MSDDSEQEVRILVCEDCGKPYPEPDPEQYRASDIWEPPVDYRSGAWRFCALCWLGVTDLVEENEEPQAP